MSELEFIELTNLENYGVGNVFKKFQKFLNPKNSGSDKQSEIHMTYHPVKLPTFDGCYKHHG